jgi:hypothetical protein
MIWVVDGEPILLMLGWQGSYIHIRFCFSILATKYQWVIKFKTHYIIVACYGIPIGIAFTMYISIYCRLILTKWNTTINNNSLHSQKRDLQVLRNIVILISLFLLGGLPLALSTVMNNQMLYLAGMCTETFSIACAKSIHYFIRLKTSSSCQRYIMSKNNCNTY